MATKPKAKKETPPQVEETDAPVAEKESKVKVTSKSPTKSAAKKAPSATDEDVHAASQSLSDGAVHEAEVAPAAAPVTAAGDGRQTTARGREIAEPAVDQKWHEIRAILNATKEDTLREISKTVKNGTDAASIIEPGGDIYDQASSERDRELGLLLGDREREKLHNIEEALLRIDEGEYGVCEECDEDIPLGRLKAMPFTRHCVKCKSDLEKLQAQTRRVEEERAYREIPLGTDEDEG